MIRLMHIATGLGLGGAEIALSRLLSKMDRHEFDLSVVSLTGPGVVAETINSMGIPVQSVQLADFPRGTREVLEVARQVREFCPDVVHTWLYGANLAGGLVTSAFSDAPIVWGVHHGDLRLEGYARATLLAAKLGAPFSRLLPSSIILCSESSRRAHLNWGYDPSKVVVIPNGFDVDTFRPDTSARRSLRDEIGVNDRVRVVGMVARFHVQKDHRNLVEAARVLAERMPTVHFVLCGPDVTYNNSKLRDLIAAAGMRDRFHLLGVRHDLPRILAGLDLATLSSMSESFPTVVGEAMSCGIPCVTTDVGDCAAIVGDTGVVVPARNPRALASGWLRLLELDEDNLRRIGLRARRRITEHYSLQNTVAKHERLYKELVGEVRGT